MSARKKVCIILFLMVFLFLPGIVQSQVQLTEDDLKSLQYRNLGPFRAGGWITDIAVPEFPEKAHLYTFYAATRNGGVWKTTNNGTTFEPIFDDQEVLSIGDVTLSPSNPDIVWVGTGEAANARSSYWGDGVYKSTDAGQTWQNMGLTDSHHIARIVIHPENPDIVYVAAMGHLYSFNEERGVFKTVNGGRTWEKVLYINEKVGVIDLVMNRKNPNILYAAAYEKYRYPWHFEEGGPESGIYKTTDAGEHWTKLGGGLPEGKIGRIGFDIYQKNPDILYAVVENANVRPPTAQEAEQDQRRGRGSQERIFGGEVYRSENAGVTWIKTNTIEDNVGGKAAYSFNQIRVDPNNEMNVFVTSVAIASSNDGGKTWFDIDWPPRRMFSRSFGDVRCFWIDPQNSDRMIMGSDGGVHITYDGGKTCDHYTNLPLGEIYAIGVDMDYPYNVYAGLQDHESWKGPSNSWSGSITLDDWVTVGTGDGMYNQVDPNDSRWLYNTSQFGDHYRLDQKLGIRESIVPRRGRDQESYRFNWNTPIHISPHNSEIIYTGTQGLLRSMHRGDKWQEISPDLTENDPVKIAGRGHIQYCTITTISESPVTPGIIWVGTDDGKVWITQNHGTVWTECTTAITETGGPANYWVSRVFASNFSDGTAYITKTGYRRDDFLTFVFMTDDFGESWTSISGNIENKPVNVIVEDRVNPDLLFLGTDRGIYVSINGGSNWIRLKNNMPTVPVHDLVIHPREKDLVAGTYGRSLFITDITPLQELNEDVLSENVHLFSVAPKIPQRGRAMGNYNLYGHRYVTTRNEPNALEIYYFLKESVNNDITITVSEPSGEIIRTLRGTQDRGINKVLWNIGRVSPGEYLVTLESGSIRLSQKALVKSSADSK
ncbi:WD40/YVTN/BNR-like repeat-containing protein [candidate division KSB1 bacterium]